jgi:hypothetical protein
MPAGRRGLRRTLVWRGLDLPRMEIARVERTGDALRASGTQIGVAYELRYELEPDLLRLEVVGERELEVRLEDRDFFDLAYSPLFNSLPVLRDRLLLANASPHDYVMRFVSVPELEVDDSEQRYEPLAPGRVRFRSGDFAADLEFDDEGFVIRYERLAERIDE